MLLQEDSFYQDSINSVVISLILAVVVVLEATGMLKFFFFQKLPCIKYFILFGRWPSSSFVNLAGLSLRFRVAQYAISRRGILL